MTGLVYAPPVVVCRQSVVSGVQHSDNYMYKVAFAKASSAQIVCVFSVATEGYIQINVLVPGVQQYN